jgi:DNA polymerase-3 subunit epsilon
MEIKKNFDKYLAVKKAKHFLKKKQDYLILDTETTGLVFDDVIVQLAITDLDGNTLFNSHIKPTKKNRIWDEIIEIHGITMNDLQNAPSLREAWPTIAEIISGKTLLMYNADFDLRLLRQTAEQDEFELPELRAQDIMKLYSSYVGEWSDYLGNYKYQALPGRNHNANGDCLACLHVIEKMAETEMSLFPRVKGFLRKASEYIQTSGMRVGEQHSKSFIE